jgi:SAM-dependent methyltransferase
LSLSDLFSRKRKDEPDAAEAGADAPVHPTKALSKFLSSLNARSQPLLLDLGPVVGTNVTFFGEELGCKILVENVFKDIDRHISEGKIDELPAFFAQRFSQADGAVDGILCWDIFDYVDWKSAQALARQLVRILRPDGAVLAQFSTTESKAPIAPVYTKYVVVDRQTLQYRPYAAARGKQRPLVNRDIQRMFEPLRITEQFLLKNNLREVLFRKAAEPVAAKPPTDDDGPAPPGDDSIATDHRAAD